MIIHRHSSDRTKCLMYLIQMNKKTFGAWFINCEWTLKDELNLAMSTRCPQNSYCSSKGKKSQQQKFTIQFIHVKHIL